MLSDRQWALAGVAYGIVLMLVVAVVREEIGWVASLVTAWVGFLLGAGVGWIGGGELIMIQVGFVGMAFMVMQAKGHRV